MILILCTLLFSGCDKNKEKMITEQETVLQEQERTECTTQQQTTEQITEIVEPLISQLMDKSTFKPNGKTPQLLKLFWKLQ